jgi:hypothetical protein
MVGDGGDERVRILGALAAPRWSVASVLGHQASIGARIGGASA